MAEYDTPAMLSHVMEVTGQDMLYYIGHSMGTITYCTACNYHPWIARATRLMVGYGGNTEVPHVKSPVFCILADLVTEINWVLDHLGEYEVAPSSWLLEWFASKVCDEEMMTQSLCTNLLFLIGGYNKMK